MSLGLWNYCDGAIQEPTLPAQPMPEQAAAFLNWTKQNNMAMGNIVLHTNASIQQEIAKLTAAETMWNRLLTKYGTPTVTRVFRDFKEVLNICIKADGHPGCYRPLGPGTSPPRSTETLAARTAPWSWMSLREQ